MRILVCWDGSAALSAIKRMRSLLNCRQRFCHRRVAVLLTTTASLWLPMHGAMAVDVMNGTELLSFCKTIDVTKKAACYGYLLAFVDFRTMAGNSSGRNCEMPAGHEIETLREQIVQKMDETPERQLDSAGTLILDFLNQKYPCR